MLSVRREQRARMGEPAFEDRTAEYCRYVIDRHVGMLDDRELLFRVRHCIAKARSYGLTWESSISIFVTHMLSINPEFDKQAVIQGVLQDTSIPADDRMTAMLGIVFDDDWDEAATQCDAATYWAKLNRSEAKEI